MKKCIVVSDSFKGTLSSREISNIARGSIAEIFPDCEVITIPIADGGEGTVECFLEALKADRVEANVTGPYSGETVQAAYARAQNTAVIEMAACAGLPLVQHRQDPGKTTTYGVGELILHAVQNGCTRILLGLGGSATNDGGCGCAAALGAVFRNAQGESFIPVGDTLNEICGIDLSAVRKNLQGVEIVVMSDVENPLYGPEGAAYVFAPQKGADAEVVKRLDDGLRAFAAAIRGQLDLDVAGIPGAGAAGVMGAGCIAFLGASIQSGIDCLLDVTGFEEKLQGADLVITGEGRIDSQSVRGKVISGIAKHTVRKKLPLIALVGCIDKSAECAYEMGVTAMFAIGRRPQVFEDACKCSAANYRKTLTDILRLIKAFSN